MGQLGSTMVQQWFVCVPLGIHFEPVNAVSDNIIIINCAIWPKERTVLCQIRSSLGQWCAIWAYKKHWCTKIMTDIQLTVVASFGIVFHPNNPRGPSLGSKLVNLCLEGSRVSSFTLSGLDTSFLLLYRYHGNTTHVSSRASPVACGNYRDKSTCTWKKRFVSKTVIIHVASNFIQEERLLLDSDHIYICNSTSLSIKYTHVSVVYSLLGKPEEWLDHTYMGLTI